MTCYVLNKPVAEVAQSVEQGTENPRVGGSIPSLGISFRLELHQLIDD
jgi:hypothetical protein